MGGKISSEEKLSAILTKLENDGGQSVFLEYPETLMHLDDQTTLVARLLELYRAYRLTRIVILTNSPEMVGPWRNYAINCNQLVEGGLFWIKAEGVFDGSTQEWEENGFSDLSEYSIRQFCAEQNCKVELFYL